MQSFPRLFKRPSKPSRHSHKHIYSRWHSTLTVLVECCRYRQLASERACWGPSVRINHTIEYNTFIQNPAIKLNSPSFLEFSKIAIIPQQICQFYLSRTRCMVKEWSLAFIVSDLITLLVVNSNTCSTGTEPPFIL